MNHGRSFRCALEAIEVLSREQHPHIPFEAVR
jgi:hypothetical protein